MTDLYLGSTSIQSSAVQYAIVSSSTSFIQIAQSDYVNFIDSIMAAVPDGTLVCRNRVKLLNDYCYSEQPCSNFSSSLQDLTLRMKVWEYVIPPEGYLLDNSENH
jgi:hypothetical protein